MSKSFKILLGNILYSWSLQPARGFPYRSPELAFKIIQYSSQYSSPYGSPELTFKINQYSSQYSSPYGSPELAFKIIQYSSQYSSPYGSPELTFKINQYSSQYSSPSVVWGSSVGGLVYCVAAFCKSYQAKYYIKSTTDVCWKAIIQSVLAWENGRSLWLIDI